jgi:RNA polymerase sigma-70 factor (ECF subfamily)
MNDPAQKSNRDFELIRSFQSGEKSAFDQLVIRHKDRIFNLCYRFLGDYNEANDYAQETFIKAFKSLKRFRFESSFSTWLYRIAVNNCKNRLRSLEKRYQGKMVSIETPSYSGENNPALEIRDNSPSPDNELESKEKSALIQTAINSLPAEQKMVIILRDIEGRSYEEIAEATGLALGTVKSRLARGRMELKTKLRKIL